jgi:hypothetical protein
MPREARERKKSAKQQAADDAVAEKADAKREQEERRDTPEVAKTFAVGVRVSCAVTTAL